jgi:glycerol-3-phosphate acyltransferase PlsY
VLILIVALSYLIGSIPVAWLIAKLVIGGDLRQMGSGNVGVMNTAISVTRWAGLLVFLAEAAKGVLAVVLARRLDGSQLSVGLAALAAIVGTRWSIWLRGAGGRGNTAAAAALLLISWPALLCLGGVWILTRVLTRSSFIAMRVMLALVPVALGLFTRSLWSALFGVAFSLLFIATHRTETDDHLLLKGRWSSLTSFLTMPRRK